MSSKSVNVLSSDKLNTTAIYVFPLRNENALQNFNAAYFYLRGNRLINYQQLGLKYKLYLCEVHSTIEGVQGQ